MNAVVDVDAQLAWARELVLGPIRDLEVMGSHPEERAAEIERLRGLVRAQGMWAVNVERRFGGAGWGQLDTARLFELLGLSPWAPAVFGAQAPDAPNAHLLAMAGTPEQIDRYLLPLVEARIHSCFAMTEPDAGADPTGMTTRAEKTAKGWRITGHKWFISGASRADFHVVAAISDPDVPRHQQMSLFLVDADLPGVVHVREIPTAGSALPTGSFGPEESTSELRYEGVEIPDDAIIGARGAGFALGQERLGPARVQHCMRWLGMARRALDMMNERAVSRHTHGSMLSEKSNIQDWIAECAVELHASRLMTLDAAAAIERGGMNGARNEISMVKLHVARTAQMIIDRAIQVHGSLGYSADMPLEQLWRTARAFTIYDGPDEVHKMAIARQQLRGIAPHEPPSDHLPSRRARVAAARGWTD